ncbi:hypothetical protein V6N12_062598 [Hibiscus sabdariffa]|uniref:Uncharacterized protein n=1 Tax=Hibiscus sabdariffa TaxID=183260 RepID=A0ABR2F9B7_9ROSI
MSMVKGPTSRMADDDNKQWQNQRKHKRLEKKLPCNAIGAERPLVSNDVQAIKGHDTANGATTVVDDTMTTS